MKRFHALSVATGLACVFAGSVWAADPPTSGPAANGSPAWHMQKSYSPDPSGWVSVENGTGAVTVVTRPPGMPISGPATADGPNLPSCSRTTVCTRKGGPGRPVIDRVTWDQTMGYSLSYPFNMPPNIGGTPGVAIDSHDNAWVSQRALRGQPQLRKFAPDGRLLLTVGPEVIGYLEKAHGIDVDAKDNVWITDVNGSTVQKISPDGKLLLTLGVKNKRGDWDEAKGQRLLWQPVSVAVAPDGTVYIGQGHANESPNDVGSDDAANVIGAARILHVTEDGKFIGQWFGDDQGPGKFGETHALAVDPKNGDVWIGDREQYRIQIYSAEGRFVRTIASRNLPGALRFDAHGDPWQASAQDGQVLKIDRSGKVLGALGSGSGLKPGEFIEANYLDFDSKGAVYAGDTSISRIAKYSPPAKKK